MSDLMQELAVLAGLVFAGLGIAQGSRVAYDVVIGSAVADFHQEYAKKWEAERSAEYEKLFEGQHGDERP